MAQAEDPETIRKAGNDLVNNDNIEGTGLDGEDEPPTEDKGENDLIVTGAQPCELPVLTEGSKQSPHTTRPRLVTNGPVGTKSSEDEDTKPTAAEEKRKAKKSKHDRAGKTPRGSWNKTSSRRFPTQ